MRGGARSGAGRKSRLLALQALMVGAYCETLWLQKAKDQAMARHGAEQATKEIRQEQDRAALTPLARGKRRMNPEITESIDEITGGRRAVLIPLRRPYGAKAEVLHTAIAWCRTEYGVTIGESKATECWKQYKRFQKSPEYKASLKST